MSDAFRQQVAKICKPLPGAEWSDPWGGGHDAWKINDKMFACMGSMTEGVSVKCADVETADLLKETGAAVNAPYFHKSWVRFLPDAEPDLVAERIRLSYDIIRSKLSAKVRKSLPEREAA